MKSLFSFFFVLSLSSFASAQNHPCAKDIEAKCAGIEKGEGRIIKCLKEHEAEISPECKSHRTEMKGLFHQAHKACQDDVLQFCEGVKKGGGRVIGCLKEHKESLSTACTDSMKEMKAKRKNK